MKKVNVINIGSCFCAEVDGNRIHAEGCRGIAGDLGKNSIGVLDGECQKIAIGEITRSIVANHCDVDLDGMELRDVSTITYTGMRKGCPR